MTMDSHVRKSMRASLGNLLLVLALVVSGCGGAGKDLPSPAGGPDGGEPAPAAASANDTPSPASADGPAVEGLPPEPMKVTVPIPNPNIAHGEVLLSRSRYYRLDVETVDKTVLVTVSRRWLYKDGFPEGLIGAIRKQPNLKETDRRLFDSRDGKIAASQYIRWEPSAGDTKPAALLLYVDGTDADGEPRHELAISVDLELDATLGKAKPRQTVVLDAMSVDLDLDQAQLVAVRWDDKPLADGNVEGDGPEHTVDIRVTGTLTAESSANIRGADALLADDVTNSFRSLAAIAFQNESHHGITLGWLGLDHLRHGLIVVPQQDGKLYDLQYSVAGQSFELDAMRRQLEATSWPIILRGRDYVGTSLSGQHVFQPVECLVSRRVKAKPAAKP
ncbi:MAG TPA: hypothetical protein DCE43_00555 [Planctomycetaceae bacterium]|nr:hypothetical protein [Planctomycetaceae bacterium]